MAMETESPLMEYVTKIVSQRKLGRDYVIAALRDSIVKTLQRTYDDWPVFVDIEPASGAVNIAVEKKVVAQVSDPLREIQIEKASELDPDVIEDVIIRVPIPLRELGRSNIYRIQHLFLQKTKDAERQNIYREFQERIGEMITGTVQRVDHGEGVLVSIRSRESDMVRAEGLIPSSDLLSTDHYRQGQSVRALVLAVETFSEVRSRPQIILSRTHADVLARLMEIEIPEITESIVEIMSVARIPGVRAKVAVRSRDQEVDPVGACIGLRGTRIQPVTKELGGERIDVIRWAPDLLEFTAKALSPAKALTLFERDEKIVAIVPDDRVDEAKGLRGQNILLASRLVGRQIVILGKSDYTPATGLVTLLDFTGFGQSVVNALKEHGLTSFSSPPTLATVYEVEGIDEKTALRIIEFIEGKLEQ